MKLNLFKVIVLIALCIYTTYSQTEFYPAKTFDFKLYGGSTNATSFFDLDGNTEFKLPDKTLDDEQPERDYIFEYSLFETGFKIEYAPVQDLVLYSEIPLNYHSLKLRADTTLYSLSDTVIMKYDTTTYKKVTAEHYLLQPAYFSIGGRYKFYSKLSYAAFLAELRIPPGFHDGIQNDPNYKFLSDGAIEFHTGLLLGIEFDKGWLESSFTYHWRGEELVDYLQIHTEFGVKTVPGSKLGANFDFIQSMGSFKDAKEFEPALTTLQENILKAGFYFQLFITDNWYVEFLYNVNLLGKNSLSKSGYLVGAGIRL